MIHLKFLYMIIVFTSSKTWHKANCKSFSEVADASYNRNNYIYNYFNNNFGNGNVILLWLYQIGVNLLKDSIHN